MRHLTCLLESKQADGVIGSSQWVLRRG